MGKSKSPAFQFYPDAWLSSTDIQLMSPAEEGAFLRLLCHAWLQPDCGLPDDDSALAVLSRLGTKWRTSSERIRRKFVSRDGRLYNERLSEERTKQDEWRAKSKVGGDKSAETRWGPKDKGGYQMVTDSAQPNGNSSSSSSSSSSKEATPLCAHPPQKPRYEPLDEAPGPSLVEATLENLREQYDVAGFLIGDIATARAKLEQILAKAVHPERSAERIKASLAAHIVHWKLHGRGKELRYWLQNEEYLSTPAPPAPGAYEGPVAKPLSAAHAHLAKLLKESANAQD